MYYFGTSGNNYYIVDKNNNDAWSFNAFGAAQGRVTAAAAITSTRGRLQEVYPLSIMGIGGDTYCSVFYNGEAFIVKDSYLSTYVKLKSKLPLVNSTTFRIQREEEYGLMQILLLIRINEFSLKQLKELLC